MKKTTQKLPLIPVKTKKKPLNLEEFVKLAKKVKKGFEEQEKYLQSHQELNENFPLIRYHLDC